MTARVWRVGTWVSVIALVLSPNSHLAECQPSNDATDPLPPGAILRLGTPRLRHAGVVSCVAYAPDGKTLASGGGDRVVRVWAADTGQELATLRHCANPVSAVAYSPDGRWLAGATSGRVVVWDRATLEPRHVENGGTNALALAFAPDSSWLAVGYQDGVLHRWSIPDGVPLPALPPGGASISNLAITDDGRWMASGEYGPTVHVWDLKQPGDAPWMYELGDAYMCAVAFSPRTTKLAVGGQRGEVAVLDVATRRLLRTLDYDRDLDRCLGLAYSRDGRWLAGAVEDAVIVWDESGRAPRKLAAGGGQLYAVAFAPDGSALAAGSGDHAVRTWSMPEGVLTPASRSLGHEGDVTAIVPLGSDRLASASQDPTVRIWDLRTARTIRRLDDPRNKPDQSLLSHSMAVTREGRRLAASSHYGTTLAWDLEHVGPPEVIPAFVDRPYSMAYSPDGSLLAAASDAGHVEVWDSATGLRRWLAHDGRAMAVAWARDGSGFATGGDDRFIVRWPVGGGTPVWRTRGARPVGRIHALALAPDGERLAAGSEFDLLVLIMATGEILTQIPTAATALAWSPSGDRVATACESGAVRIWSLADQPGGESVSSVIERLIGHLGAATWETREAATLDLVLLGETARPQLETATQSADLEIVTRARSALSAIDARGKQPDSDTLALRRLLKTYVTAEGATTALAWSPDGTRVYAGTSRGTILVWDAGKERPK